MVGAALAAAALLSPAPFLAGAARATTVSPVVIDLQSTGRQVVSNISVQNTGAGPLPMEIRVQPLAPTATGLEPAGESEGLESEDLLVVPPLAIVPAGETQTFRVQWIGDPELAGSRHYHVTVAQLPVELPEGQSAVQIVYNFQVLVNVSPGDKEPQLSVVSAGIGDRDGTPAPVITVRNTGGAHGYLSQHRVRILEKDASGAEVFNQTMSGAEFQQLVGYGLVASGQTRELTIPMELPSRTGTVSVEILEERLR